MSKYTQNELEVVSRYLFINPDASDEDVSIILKLKKRIPKYRPDKFVIASCESAFLAEDNTFGRPKNQINNKEVVDGLKGMDYGSSSQRFWWLDDILVGVCNLDMGGNTRGIHKGSLYAILSEAEIINTKVIQEIFDVGARQSQKIMLALRIAHRMILKQITRRCL